MINTYIVRNNEPISSTFVQINVEHERETHGREEARNKKDISKKHTAKTFSKSLGLVNFSITFCVECAFMCVSFRLACVICLKFKYMEFHHQCKNSTDNSIIICKFLARFELVCFCMYVHFASSRIAKWNGEKTKYKLISNTVNAKSSTSLRYIWIY